YLVLSDLFDPGWSATVDGKPAAIRPAYVAFRAVYLGPGKHTVRFEYEPAGFKLGLRVTALGALACLVLVLAPGKVATLATEHETLAWPRSWPLWGIGLLAAVIVLSAVKIDARGHIAPHPRWQGSFHRFTWGAGIEGMRPARTRAAENEGT